MAYELGADVNIKNNLNVTPLTLAAKLARRELFFHILNIEREIYWQIGSVTCAAYPLTQLDTIDEQTGSIQKDSALNLVVFGESVAHLDLIEGAVIDLLHAKWNTFVKFRFYKQFVMFFIYFLLSGVSFVSRPVHSPLAHRLRFPRAKAVGNFTSDGAKNISMMEMMSGTFYENSSDYFEIIPALAHELVFDEMENNNIENSGDNQDDVEFMMEMRMANDSGNGTIQEVWFGAKCFPKPRNGTDMARQLCEVLMVICAIFFLLGALRECKFLGASMFFENLVRFYNQLPVLNSSVSGFVIWNAQLNFSGNSAISSYVLVFMHTG